MPTVDEERKDPMWADIFYRSAVKWLIENTRNRRQFNLLFEENVSYGFRRNSLGLKPLAVTLAGASIALVAWHVYVAAQPHEWTMADIVSVAVSVVSIIYWFTIVTGFWVRDAGNGYARTLLSACDSPMASNPKKQRLAR